MNTTKILLAFVVALLVWAGMSLLMGFPFMWMWNWLMPEIFGLKVLTFWQSVGLMFFCGMLFKSTHASTSKD